MLAVDVNALPMETVASSIDPTLETRYNFPIFTGTGSAATAVVYFEIDPGKRLGRHIDSAEEVLYVIEGEGEATIGDETARVSGGSLAVVPALVPHGVRNVGSVPLKVVGFFAGSGVVSIFDEPVLPGSDVAVLAHGPGGTVLYGGSPIVPAGVN